MTKFLIFLFFHYSDQIVKTYNYELDNQDAKCAIMCILQSSQIVSDNNEHNFYNDELPNFFLMK